MRFQRPTRPGRPTRSRITSTGGGGGGASYLPPLKAITSGSGTTVDTSAAESGDWITVIFRDTLNGVAASTLTGEDVGIAFDYGSIFKFTGKDSTGSPTETVSGDATTLWIAAIFSPGTAVTVSSAAARVNDDRIGLYTASYAPAVSGWMFLNVVGSSKANQAGDITWDLGVQEPFGFVTNASGYIALGVRDFVTAPGSSEGGGQYANGTDVSVAADGPRGGFVRYVPD